MTHRHRFTARYATERGAVIFECCEVPVPERQSVFDGAFTPEYVARRGGLLECGRERVVVVPSRLIIPLGQHGVAWWGKIPKAQMERLVERARRALRQTLPKAVVR